MYKAPRDPRQQSVIRLAKASRQIFCRQRRKVTDVHAHACASDRDIDYSKEVRTAPNLKFQVLLRRILFPFLGRPLRFREGTHAGFCACSQAFSELLL